MAIWHQDWCQIDWVDCQDKLEASFYWRWSLTNTTQQTSEECFQTPEERKDWFMLYNFNGDTRTLIGQISDRLAVLAEGIQVHAHLAIILESK